MDNVDLPAGRQDGGCGTNCIQGYAHDWEFVSRWVKGGEKWVATKKPTLIYNAETCGQKEFLKALAASIGKPK